MKAFPFSLFLPISPSVSISVFLPHLFIISTSEMDKYNPMMFKKKKKGSVIENDNIHIYYQYILIKSKMNNLRSASGIQLSEVIRIELYVWWCAAIL